jgi:glucose/arabinose dehydrogenase
MPVGPTAIKFLHSDKLGKQYQNDIFVGDIIHGNIYHFKLNANRTELLLRGPLADKIANYTQENEPVIFASGFAGITDMEVGPDGYLYIATLRNGKYNQEETISSNGGTIYRIEPANRLVAEQFDNSTEKFYEKLGTTALASPSNTR